MMPFIRTQYRYAISRLLALSIMSSTVAFGATEVQPTISIAATYTDDRGSDSREISTSGAEIDARLRFIIFDDRGQFVISPRVRATTFDDSRATEEEEQQ